jgi:hypothetical protein
MINVLIVKNLVEKNMSSEILTPSLKKKKN